jgi:hypothetical protein
MRLSRAGITQSNNIVAGVKLLIVDELGYVPLFDCLSR